MKHNFIFEKYTMLHSFKLIIAIFLLALCAIQATECKPEEEVDPKTRPRIVKVLCVDDDELNHRWASQAVRVYNRNRGDSPEIVLLSLRDGDEVTVDLLKEVHLVLCDIHMPREHGHEALVRLKKEAESHGFILPPFIATTSETDYHNIGEGDPVKHAKRLEHASRQHFEGGRDKVCTFSDLQRTLEYCRMRLGDNWLKTHVGRHDVPTSALAREVECDELAEMLEEPEHPTGGSASISSRFSKKYSDKELAIDSSTTMHGSSVEAPLSPPRQRTSCDWRKLLCCKWCCKKDRVTPYPLS